MGGNIIITRSVNARAIHERQAGRGRESLKQRERGSDRKKRNERGDASASERVRFYHLHILLFIVLL